MWSKWTIFAGFSDILDVFSGQNKDIDMIPSNFIDTCLENQQAMVWLQKWLPKTQKWPKKPKKGPKWLKI